MNKECTNYRVEYLDILRIMATIAVVMIHVLAKGWYENDITTFRWQIYNLFYGIVRWAVPVFVMISGALFLGGKEKTLKNLYGKNIVKIITAFYFWSALYAIIYARIHEYGLGDTVSVFLKGHYHMWFLFMIAGLYMLVPILRKITESIELTKYTLVLLMVFSVLFPFLLRIISIKFDGIGSVISQMFDRVDFLTSLGYVYYFLLGYYLSRIEINEKEKRFIYILGILGTLLTVCLTNWVSQLYQMQDETFGSYLNLNVMLESIAIFMFIKCNCERWNIGKKLKKIVQKLSKYSFGAYLIHAMVLTCVFGIVERFAILENPFLEISIITIVVVIISYAISAMINKISILKKYIV